MNLTHRLRALALLATLLAAAAAGCTQGPGASAPDGPAASPSPSAVTAPPSASPSSSGGKGDYDY